METSGPTSLTCSWCSSCEKYLSGYDFLRSHQCEYFKRCLDEFLTDYSTAIENISKCSRSIELCNLLTYCTEDPLVVQVYQDARFLRDHAPGLYDFSESGKSCSCAEWAALILSVKLCSNDPQNWKSSDVLKVYLTALPSKYSNNGVKLYNEVTKEWDWDENSESESEFNEYESESTSTATVDDIDMSSEDE